jgi:lipopolysaccharide/colanic/teichoic acid biosynthesis glycosyltransferase
MKVEDNNFQPVDDHDKRITPVGHFLRRTRLDEIPQFINILRGEMSIIGPRPERPELVQTLAHQIPFYHIRHLIKPGVTGWDQVSGEYHSPSLEDTYKKLQYDLFYLKHCSIYLDSTIILKTIATVIARGGK